MSSNQGRSHAAHAQKLIRTVSVTACAALAVSLLNCANAQAAVHTATSASSHANSADPRIAARAKAVDTGHPVAVDALTTADSTTVANPDGTLTTTTTAQPTRMKNSNGTWVEINPALKRNSDGSITTTATPNSLTLSGGGTGAVVSVADGSGHAIALSLPLALPSPTVSGASATYANIYPGVDLTVTAQDSGGFSEVFTVHDAAAQAAAKGLKFTLSATGLNVAQDAAGNLKATDSASGQVVAVAPAPSMWDSASEAAHANSAPENGIVTTPRSSAAGPGTGAHAAKLPVTLGSNSLTVDGDTAPLGTAPTYPLYLDPSWTLPYQSGGTINYAEVQGPTGGPCSGYTTYDNISQPGVGYNDYDSCIGPYRSYFQIDTSNVLNPAYDIKSATLKINEVYSALNSCNQGSESIAIYTTGRMPSNVTWGTAPQLGAQVTVKPLQSVGNSAGTMCSGGTVPGDFDVSAGIASARAGNWPDWTFAMVGNETAGSHSLQRFNNNPSITTVYDIKPDAPTSLTTTPTPVVSGGPSAGGGTQSCGTGIAYVGVASLNGTNVATLSAKLTSQVPSAQMYGHFHLTDHSTSPSTETYTDSSGYVTSGGTVSVQTPSLIDGHVYTWEINSSDQYDPSDLVGYCTFVADETLPTNPAVTSTDFPASGSGATGGKYNGQSGSLTLSATDPNPSTGSASGLRGYFYSLDTPIPVNGANFTPASGTATISITPAQWGTHTLYVQSIDNAGNVSGQTQYHFYVPWNSTTKVIPGDVNGDGIPDLVLTNTAGNLIEYPGNADPALTPVTLSTPAFSPGGQGAAWSQYLVTHRGSFTNQGMDDLWAYDTVGHGLYLYKNFGTNAFENTGNVTRITKANVASDAYNTSPTSPDNSSTACATTKTGACTAYDNTDWSTVTQLLAVGDFYSGDPVSSYDNGVSGLLTVEGGSLWYYQGQTSQFYLGTAVQLGSSGWGNVTLLAPGTVAGKPTLWARDNATGTIYQYTITFDSNGYPVNLGTPSNGTALSIPGGTALTQTAYPAITSPGDLHAAGYPDLVATTANGTVLDYPGAAPNGSGLATFAAPRTLENTGATNTETVFHSDNTLYADGSTWSTAGAVMSFNQGLLTITNHTTGALFFTAGAGGHPGAVLVMQLDGNLVIYPDSSQTAGTALWSSSTAGHAGNAAILRADGTLAIYNDPVTRATRLWMDAPADGTLVREPNGTIALAIGGALISYLNPTELSQAGYAGAAATAEPQGFIEADPATVPADGSLIRNPANGAESAVAGGAQIHFISTTEVTNAGDGSKTFYNISTSYFTAMATVPVNGTLVRGSSTTQVWQIQGGKKVASSATYGYTIVSESWIDGLATG